MNGSLPELRI